MKSLANGGVKKQIKKKKSQFLKVLLVKFIPSLSPCFYASGRPQALYPNDFCEFG